MFLVNKKIKAFKVPLPKSQKDLVQLIFIQPWKKKQPCFYILIVKNHSFVDGNKRIAAACFLKFLQQNEMLFNAQGQPIINSDTLASLTLFIASSKPEEIETVKRLVISVLNRNK